MTFEECWYETWAMLGAYFSCQNIAHKLGIPFHIVWAAITHASLETDSSVDFLDRATEHLYRLIYPQVKGGNA